MLRPRNDILRERILSIGQPGSGKSYGWLRIADLAQKTKSPAHFYCIDTDDAIERMLYEEFSHLHNVTSEVCFSYPDMAKATENFKALAKPGDWIIFDMISALWEEAQEHYINEVMGQRSSDYFLRIRKMMQDADKTGSPIAEGLEGWRDWGQINKMNTTVMKDLIGNVANIYAVAPVDELSGKEDKDSRLAYGGLKVKPRGQKKLGHWFHTILWFQQMTMTDYAITTVKDRGRKLQNQTPLKNFALDYLLKIAGWKL